jgi:hypothetical protein
MYISQTVGWSLTTSSGFHRPPVKYESPGKDQFPPKNKKFKKGLE